MSKTPTQNDWENRYAKLIKNRSDYPGAYRNQDGFDCTPDEMKDFIDKAVADERKEVMWEVRDAISKLKIITPEREPPKNKLTQNQIFATGQMNMLVRLNDVLATLRKETK